MNRVVGFIIKIIIGVVVVEWLASAFSVGGALNGLTGMLIAKYPFHGYLLEVFSDTMGYDVSFVPAGRTSLLDDVLILVIAMLISSGIAGVLGNIFNPVDSHEEAYIRSAGYRFKGMAAAVLSSIVTILFSNMIFGSIVQWLSDLNMPSLVLTLIEIAAIAAVIVVFAVFISAMAGAVSGKGFSFGLFAFFAVRAVIRTVLVVVLSVWALLGIVNHASDAAMVLIGIYVILVLVSTAARGLRV